ncbi:MAG: xanthine dehydrogenase molybdopterin binding subunit [Halobacteriovoraceae bacterium]|nr:xanthine dehydrogenase molybdopterin binding subunit [Halobacteriovoraceae bacterium]
MTKRKYQTRLGTSSPHDSAITHVSGQSEFIDDKPPIRGELHVALALSPYANAKIKKIDFKEALEQPGVVAVLIAKDLAANLWGPITKDQPLLAEDMVSYCGEPFAVVVAKSHREAYQARDLIKLEVNEKTPVLSIPESQKSGLFLGESCCIQNGDVEKQLKQSAHILEGTFSNKGQEHFYLEGQAAIVYPGEQGQLTVHSSSQHPTEVQHIVASAVGIAFNKVVSIVKRMGGGFGGKESQSSHIAALCALAATKTNSACRLILDKDDDMAMTGKRHPFLNDYKVGFSEDGKIEALKVNFFADGGAFVDLSPAILQRAMFHIDNAYYLPHSYIEGRICKTNTAPNTAFRGFGGPQGAAVIESILEDIAVVLKKDAYVIRRLNCYQGTDLTTPYGQAVENNVLPELFDRLAESSDYKRRRQAVKLHNLSDKFTLKGLSITACKFGISFTSKFLNQASAQVNIHTDGTLQVSTGATEMGQGVNTKIAGIVSEAFGLAMSSVILMPTSTEKNHNTSATAASSGSDLNGSAALKACNLLKARLAKLFIQKFETPTISAENEYDGEGEFPFAQVSFKDAVVSDGKNSMPFVELIQLAYMNRISLGEYAHFKTPKIWFDRETGKGRPFLYYTNGVACSEVSIDRFTGETKIIRTDILMDLGRRINEGIDYGQVSGAFVQSAGWVTTEDLYYSEKGALISHSPTTYKIPSIQDLPREFNIDFIENETNVLNVRKSKAVGEPPFLLGLSVWNAVKNALSYVKKDHTEVSLPLPATAEVILTKIDQLENS